MKNTDNSTLNIPVQNFIGGVFGASLLGETLDLQNPATAKSLGTVPNSSVEDLEVAVRAADAAFITWSQVAPRERAGILRQMSQLILKRRHEFASLESTDSGKTFKSAWDIDIPRSAYNFEFFADAITQQHSETHSNLESGNLNFTLRQPLGVVACISPWNLPLYLLTWKIAPALAAGNCVIAKPSEVTPMTATLLCEVAQEAGLPPGVLNVLHGHGARFGERMCTHPKIKAISFTGSTATGKQLAQWAAPHFKKLSLEMGGKNATLVFADCDWEKTVSETLRAAFSNQGQICLCGSRILIEQSIYEKFKAALVKRAQSFKVGNPFDVTNHYGALVSKTHFEKVQAAVTLAKTDGGKILCGGGSPNARDLANDSKDGFYFLPTLIEGLGPQSSSNQDEIFGPVATLQSFSTDAEAVKLANATSYGLSASLWTQNLGRAHRVAAELESGIVWVNTWMNRDLRTPFGGVKNSGLGREGGVEALNFFNESKNVCVDFSMQNPGKI